ncbi:response regulator [Pseudoduganella sp. RAF53_2]|uniref:response regulator n=1 Tax=unclassified Pseudoduganella TaxID=2637179 RepID=UPI003F9A4756
MKLPVYFHPTTTVLVDDSDTFLRSLSFQLDPSQPNISFYDTLAALDWFGRSARRADLPLHVNFDDPHQSAERRNVEVDLERIWRLSTQPQRFAMPSVLVVDYSMPQMDGLAFCQALRTHPCKKILFTGAADEKIAVDAFNRGLIDRYIRKSADDALDQLERELADLQKQFFQEQSKTVCDMLALHDFSFLSCDALAGVVQALYQAHGFVEHYVFPNPSGILFFDRAGKATLMIIETEKGLRSQFEMACDSNAPPSLLAALDERRILPFFHHVTGDGMYAAAVGEHWHRYCRKPEVCEGRETYYWALFEVPAGFLEGVNTSFDAFQRSQRPALAA